MSTVVLPCSCQNSFQDQTFGKGMRLHNIGKEESGGRKATCTVCGAVKHLSAKSSTKEANEPKTTPKKKKSNEPKKKSR